jgi:hypothetical protein
MNERRDTVAGRQEQHGGRIRFDRHGDGGSGIAAVSAASRTARSRPRGRACPRATVAGRSATSERAKRAPPCDAVAVDACCMAAP